MTSMTEGQLAVTGGVDTHRDTHTAVVVDCVGRVLGTEEFAACEAGYAALLAWMAGFGELTQIGVEGTGTYGAGLTRHLRAAGVAVARGDPLPPADAPAARHVRPHRRRGGRPRGAQRRGGRTAQEPRRGGGGHPRAARRPPRSGQGLHETLNELQNLVLTAPESLRARLQGCSNHQRVDQAARFRPGDLTDPVEATKAALRCLARRHQELQAEIARLDAAIAELLPQAAPKEFLAKQGVGPQVAATLLVTVGDNAERITSNGSFAAVCDSSPVDCSSGKHQRHRLNPRGDRQANSALWRIVRTRMQHDPRTRLRRTTHPGRQDREGDHPLPRALPRPGGLQVAYQADLLT